MSTEHSGQSDRDEIDQIGAEVAVLVAKVAAIAEHVARYSPHPAGHVLREELAMIEDVAAQEMIEDVADQTFRTGANQ